MLSGIETKSGAAGFNLAALFLRIGLKLYLTRYGHEQKEKEI
jgi:hypothetical protein